MNELDFGFFYTALAIGFLGGSHCFGMCGGIVSAMSLTIRPTAKLTILKLNVGYNIGRILSYCLAGFIAGGLGLLLGKTFSWVAITLNILASLFIIALGLYISGLVNVLYFTETIGNKLWHRIQPVANKFYPFKTLPQAITAGFLWGFIPCAMVYAVLAWSVTAANPIIGAWYMLGFGLGTLPTLLLIGVFAGNIKSLLHNQLVKIISGGLIAVYGVSRLISFLLNF